MLAIMANMDHKDSSNEFVIALSLSRSTSSHTEFSSLLMLNASVASQPVGL